MSSTAFIFAWQGFLTLNEDHQASNTCLTYRSFDTIDNRKKKVALPLRRPIAKSELSLFIGFFQDVDGQSILQPSG
jgi:hypothetical protein